MRGARAGRLPPVTALAFADRHIINALALKRKTPTGWRRFSIRMSSFSTMATPKFGEKMPSARRGAGCSAILARCASKPCIKR